MLVNYNEMLDDSRVWIYQSNRLLSDVEVNQLSISCAEFVKDWTAHNAQLKAAFEIRYNCFIILLVDESHNDASGCSIDKSVRFMQKVEQELNVSLMNRMLFAYKKGEAVEVVSKDQFEKLFKEGFISDNTIVFNNLIQTKAELESYWKVPLGKSWNKQLV